jgi:hypothetical protein
MRNAPPIEAGWAAITTAQGRMKSEIFFAEGLDHPNQLESADEISLRAHAIFVPQKDAAIERRYEIARLICPSGKSVHGIRFARPLEPFAQLLKLGTPFSRGRTTCAS